MGKLTLNIYGKNDEILKTYETEHIRWIVYIESMKISEEISGKSEAEAILRLGDFMKKLFPGLTDKELEMADAGDIINTFIMVTHGGGQIKAGKGKNA